MGDIHTPKTIYKNRLVMEFYVKGKEMFYKLSVWDENGVNESVIDSAKLGDNKPMDLINKALHLVGRVEVNQ